MSYCMDKPNFLEFQVKMAKMTLKVKVNDLHFQSAESILCLLQIWWFYPKSVMSYFEDKSNFR